MPDNTVCYRFCEKYDYDIVKDAIEKIFSTFPELEGKIRNKKVLIKPNLLAPRHPDLAVTAHPVVLRALVNHIKNFNCEITIADSSVGTYNQKNLEKLYKTCQIDEVARETGCKLNFDTTDAVIPVEGQVLKKCHIIKPVIEADFIINVPKLKTHGLTRLTCATKNLFGMMPGILKVRQHLAMPDIQVFSQMLLDMNSYFEDRIFHIVDGIIGMEGEGPSGGDPKFTGALFGGYDSGFVDILAGNIMGMPVNSIPTLINYKDMTVENLNLINSDEIRTYNFSLPPVRSRSIPDKFPRFLQNIIMDLVIAKPVINKKTCLKCNLCAESCPAQIITMQKTGAHIPSYANCIRCYCCQEACPHRSIHLSKPIVENIYKTFRKLYAG